MAKGNKTKSLGPEFECGMLAGFTDGVSLIHRMLTDAVEFTAPTHPGISAFLKGLTDSMRKDIPGMLRDYHEAKGLSVPFDITIADGVKKWN